MNEEKFLQGTEIKFGLPSQAVFQMIMETYWNTDGAALFLNGKNVSVTPEELRSFLEGDLFQSYFEFGWQYQSSEAWQKEGRSPAMAASETLNNSLGSLGTEAGNYSFFLKNSMLEGAARIRVRLGELTKVEARRLSDCSKLAKEFFESQLQSERKGTPIAGQPV